MSETEITPWSFAASAHATMLAGFADKPARRGYCGDCDGSGFEKRNKNRHARKCQRCRGKGSVEVGHVRR